MRNQCPLCNPLACQRFSRLVPPWCHGESGGAAPSSRRLAPVAGARRRALAPSPRSGRVHVPTPTLVPPIPRGCTAPRSPARPVLSLARDSTTLALRPPPAPVDRRTLHDLPRAATFGSAPAVPVERPSRGARRCPCVVRRAPWLGTSQSVLGEGVKWAQGGLGVRAEVVREAGNDVPAGKDDQPCTANGDRPLAGRLGCVRESTGAGAGMKTPWANPRALRKDVGEPRKES